MSSEVCCLVSVEEENVDLIQRWVELGNTWELPAEAAKMKEYFTPDFKDHVGNRDFQGGIDSWMESEVGVQKAFPDMKSTLVDIIAKGDRVWARIKTKGRHTGEFLGIPPIGKEVEFECVAIYHIVDGRVVDRRLVVDQMDWADKLGIIEIKRREDTYV